MRLAFALPPFQRWRGSTKWNRKICFKRTRSLFCPGYRSAALMSSWNSPCRVNSALSRLSLTNSWSSSTSFGRQMEAKLTLKSPCVRPSQMRWFMGTIRTLTGAFTLPAAAARKEKSQSPSATRGEDLTTAQSRIRLPREMWSFTHGRGLYLMQMLMDEIRFERSGAVVHMRKTSAKVNPASPRQL